MLAFIGRLEHSPLVALTGVAAPIEMIINKGQEFTMFLLL